MSDVTTGWVDVSGARLSWHTSAGGTGTTVIWAHGLFADSTAQESAGHFDWRPVERAGLRLVRYDARAHGRSTGTTLGRDYTWESLGRDLLAVLDAVSPDRPVHAIGASMGTATILHAVARRPDRFDRLVLAIPPTWGDTRRTIADNYLARAKALEHAAPTPAPVSGSAPPPVFADRDPQELWPPETVDERLLPAVLRGAAASDLPSACALARIHHPALVLSWTDDPAHPVSSGEYVASALADARLRVDGTPGGLAEWGREAAGFLIAKG